MILKPVKGTFPWPGRDRLSPRDRLLLESRTVEELFQGLGRLDAASDLESVLRKGDIRPLITTSRSA